MSMRAITVTASLSAAQSWWGIYKWVPLCISHRFRSITWKWLKISQQNLLHILSKNLIRAFWY